MKDRNVGGKEGSKGVGQMGESALEIVRYQFEQLQRNELR